MRNTMNSLTQPTECNKKKNFAISICAHSTTSCGVSQKSTLLHTRPLGHLHHNKATQTFCWRFSTKILSVYQKEKVFSHLLFWLLQNFPELHVATFNLSSFTPHPALTTDCPVLRVFSRMSFESNPSFTFSKFRRSASLRLFYFAPSHGIY